jgi:CheY-like chemotaxis protein
VMTKAVRPIEVLLVEDDPGDVVLTKEAFADNKVGNNLTVVSDGEEATAFLRRQGEYADAPRPDMILLDLNLPRKDGREVLEEIKADPALRSIPVVVLTTSDADEDILRSYDLHANAYVTKPVDFDQFIQVVRQIDDFFVTVVKLRADPTRSFVRQASPRSPIRVIMRVRAQRGGTRPMGVRGLPRGGSWLALAAAAVTAVAGCTPSPPSSSAAETSKGRAKRAAQGSEEAPVPKTAKIVRSRQHGFALPSWSTGDYDGPHAAAYVRAIADTGASWLQLNPTWYQKSPRDDAPRTTDETASDDSVRHIVGLARAAGLKVLLKPHVDLLDEQDRATISPADPDRWFAAYTRFIVHYAELARESGAAEFAVGTELAGVSGERAEWLAVIKAVRARFHGPLVYAANYDEYAGVEFWDALDLIGVDAYWPLTDGPTTDPAVLRRSWQPIAARLAAFSAEHDRKILFTEAGYVSQRGATNRPFAWTISDVRGDEEQAAAYRALLEAFSGQKWWGGVHWWMWDDWPGAGETPHELAYSPHHKPAEQVVREWWRGR